jgi:Ca-activated chloride channel family protein
MRSRWRKISLGVGVAAAMALGLWALAVASAARAQSTQQPSGPGSQSGEEIYTPKKAPPSEPVPTPGNVNQPIQQNKPEKINPKNVYTLSTSTNLVNVNVLVTDSNGDPIPGLQQANFRIYDDGVQQTITNFSTAAAPMTACLLVEFSNKWWGYLYLALEDAYQFVNFMRPQDWVAVVSFGMRPHILQDFTHDRYAVKSALDSLRIPGFSETNLYDALNFTLGRMQDIQGRKGIILICTGFDTFSKLTYGQILKIIRASNTPIYPVSILSWVTVRYGSNIDTLQARNALTTFAKYSGGEAYFPRFSGELPSIYRQIAGQLRQEYSLGFIPTNPARNGKYHKLKVELVAPDGNPLKIVNQKGKVVKYRIVSREGYYAHKS